jgi:hypothetical protein
MIPTLEIFPLTRDWINEDEHMKIEADAQGYPAKALRTNDEVARIRADRAKRQQAIDMAQLQEKVAGTAEMASKAKTKSGKSVLDMELQKQAQEQGVQ